MALPVRIGGRVFAVTAAGPEPRVLPRMPEIGAMIRAALVEECGEAALEAPVSA